MEVTDLGLQKLKIVDEIAGSISNKGCVVELRKSCQKSVDLAKERDRTVVRISRSLSYNV
jgi:hypothetical protein